MNFIIDKEHKQVIVEGNFTISDMATLLSAEVLTNYTIKTMDTIDFTNLVMQGNTGYGECDESSINIKYEI